MKRLKKIVKWTGIVLGALVAIGLVANAVFVWITDARLERQLAEIRAAGDPLTLAELARPPIAPEKNAATYLRRAEADLAAIEKETVNLRSVWEPPGFLMSPEDQKTVQAALAAYPNVIPLLQQAAACPDYNAELDYTLPSREFLDAALVALQKLRWPAQVLRYRAALLVAEGNRDEAVRTALTNFRLARHLDRNPVLVGYMIALVVRRYAMQSANEALQTGPVSKEARQALDQELAIQERMEGYARALKSERVFMLASFRETIPLRNFWLIARGSWNKHESACLDMLSPFIAQADNTGPYCPVTQTPEIKKHTLAALLFPSLDATHLLVARTRAEIRSLRVLNALQTHLPAGSDKVPKITELGLPAQTIADPFDPFGRELLHIKKTPQGWLVYSVGVNQQDDGGKVGTPGSDDVGVGPPPAPENNDRAKNGGEGTRRANAQGKR